MSIINKEVKIKSVLGILALIIPVTLGIFQMIDWMRPKAKADVKIKYHILSLEFPNEYGKSIYDFFCLAMDDSNFKKLLYEKIDSASVNKFLATDPFEFRFRNVLKMKIINNGTTTAKNLKILFPRSNFIRLENRGKQIVENYKENYIDISELRSDDEFEVTCWGDYHLSLYDNKISASYDGGKATFEADKNVFDYSYEPHIPLLYRLQAISTIILVLIVISYSIYIIFIKLKNYFKKYISQDKD